MGKKKGGAKFSSAAELREIKKILGDKKSQSLRGLSQKLKQLALSGNLEKVLEKDKKEPVSTLSKEVVESANFPDEGDHREFQHSDEGYQLQIQAQKICKLIDYGFNVDAKTDLPIRIYHPITIQHILRHERLIEQNQDYSISLKHFVNRRIFLTAGYEPEAEVVRNMQIAIGKGDFAIVQKMAKSVTTKYDSEKLFDGGKTILFALMRLIENSNPDLTIGKQYEKILKYLINSTPKELLQSLESLKFPHPEIIFEVDYKKRIQTKPIPFKLMEIAYKHRNLSAVKILHEAGGLKLTDSELNSYEESYRYMLNYFSSIMTHAIDDPELLKYTIENHDGAKIFDFMHLAHDQIHCINPFQGIYMDDEKHLKSLEILTANIFGPDRKEVILGVILGEEKARKLIKQDVPGDKISAEELRLLMVCFSISPQDLQEESKIENLFIKELVPRIIAKCDELALEFVRSVSDRERHFCDITKATQWIDSLNKLGEKLEAEQGASTNRFLVQSENQELCEVLRLKPVDLILSSEDLHGKTPIVNAIESGDPAVLGMFLESYSKPEELATTRMNINGKLSTAVAYALMNPDMHKEIFKNGIDITPSIFLLTQNKNEDAAINILDSYCTYLKKSETEMADAKIKLLVNSELYDTTPLTIAIKARLPKLTEKLVELGADINRAPTSSPESNPLIACCHLDNESKADIAIAQMLIDKGASHIALPDSNFTAVHMAAIHGNLEKFKLLTDQSYLIPELINSPIARNYDAYIGKTLLALVCDGKNPESDLEIAKILIDRGAQITPKIIRTALSKASFEMVQLLWGNATEEQKLADIELPTTHGFDLVAMPTTFVACHNLDIRVGMFLLDQKECDASQIYYPGQKGSHALSKMSRKVAGTNILHSILMSPKNSEEDIIKIIDHILKKFPAEKEKLFSQMTSISKEFPHSLLAIACDKKTYKVASYLLQQGHRPVIAHEGMIRGSYEIDARQRLVIDIIKDKINSLFEGESHDSELKANSEEEIRHLTSLLHHIVIKNDKEKDNQLLTANILRAIGIDKTRISLLTGQKGRFDGCLTMDETWMIAACLGAGPNQFGAIGKEKQPNLFESVSQNYKDKGDNCAKIIVALKTEGASKEEADEQIKFNRSLSSIKKSQAGITQELQEAKKRIKFLQQRVAKLDPEEQERILATKKAQELRDQEEATKLKRSAALVQAEKARYAAKVASWQRIAKEKAAAQKAEEARIARERAAAQKAERDRIAREKAAAQKAEKARIAAERAAAQKAEKDRIAAERAAAQKAEKDRIAEEKARDKEQKRQQEEKAKQHYNSRLQKIILGTLKQNVSDSKEKMKGAEQHFNHTLLKKHFRTFKEKVREEIDVRRKFRGEISSSSIDELLIRFKEEKDTRKLAIIEEAIKSGPKASKTVSAEAATQTDLDLSVPVNGQDKIDSLQEQLRQYKEQAIDLVTHNGFLQSRVLVLENSMMQRTQENAGLRDQVTALSYQLQMLYAQHPQEVFYPNAQLNPAFALPQNGHFFGAGHNTVTAQPRIDKEFLAEQRSPPSASPEPTTATEGGRRSARGEGK